MIETNFYYIWVLQGLKTDVSSGCTVAEHLPHYPMVSGSRPAELETPDRETL